MTAIKATWTGGGLEPGTSVVAANINAEGNSFGTGVTWVFAGTTPAEDRLGVADGHGVRITTSTAGALFMIRAMMPSGTTAMRSQAIVTIPDITPDAPVGVIQANEVETGRGWVRLRPERTFELYHSQDITASRSPAMPVGTKALVDVVHHAGAGAGRMFFRVTNLSDSTWNGSGYWFYDTGYTLPAAAEYTRVQFGKSTTGTALGGTGLLIERLGAEAITVSSSDTSEAAASAYFADEPGDPLPSPVVTITGTVNPSGPGVADGSITASWPSVPGATSYQAGIATGDTLEGITLVESGATSPYTWSSLLGGTYTVAVRAVP